MDRKTMMHFYKARSEPFGITEMKRKDNEKLRLERKDRRTRMFNDRRSISGKNENKADASDNMSTENISTSTENKLRDRQIALQKYKHEKEVIKQSLKQKKRPPFVVGIPHHGNSPVLKEINGKISRSDPKQIATKTQVGNQRVTRANSKLVQGNAVRKEVFVPKSPVRMFPFNERKSIFSFQLNKGASMKKLTSPHTPTVLKRSAQKSVQVKERALNNLKKGLQNHGPVAKVLKNVLQIKKKPSTSSTDSGQSLAAPLPNVDALDDIGEHTPPEPQLDSTPSSPIVIGISNVATEELQNNILNLEVSNKLETKSLEEFTILEKHESPRVDSRKSCKEEERIHNEITVQRERVDNESGRLLSLAEEWESISLKEVLPQDVIDEIDSVIGQTRLLTRDKFNQFRGLIDQYQNQQGSKEITLDDLNGFWDMVYLQVESLIKKFSHLEILKHNNWEEPKTDIPLKKRRRGPPKSKPKKIDSEVRKKTDPNENVNLPLSISSFSNITRRSKRSEKNILVKQELLVEPLMSGGNTLEAVPCTPRRSLRLVGRTPTTVKTKCSTCQTPDCDLSNCANLSEKKNTLRRKSSMFEKNATSPGRSELLNVLRESSPFGLQPGASLNVQPENSGEANRTSKRFILRPSKLILDEFTNKSPVPKKARKPLSVREENLNREEELNNSNLNSCLIRRSTRLHSAKKVTFNSSLEDKSNVKIPATPYGRKGFNRESFPE